MAADHDDVRAFRFGCLDHRRPGIALPDQVLRGDAQFASVRHDLGESGFALGPSLVDAGVKQAAREPEAGWIDHAEEDQACPHSR